MYTSQLWFGGNYLSTTRKHVGRRLFPSGAQQDLSIGQSQVSSFAVRGDGRRVAACADATVVGRLDLVTVANDGTGLVTLQQAAATGLSTGCRFVRYSPDGTRLFYEMDNAGSRQSFVINASGIGAPINVTVPRGNTTGFIPVGTTLSHDGSLVAFVGDFTVDNINEVWLVDTRVTTPMPIAVWSASFIGTTPNYGANSPVLFTGTNKLLWKGRTQAETRFRLYQANSDGTGIVQFPGLADGSAGAFGLSASGASLAYAGSTAAANSTYEVFVGPADGSATATRVSSGTAASGRGTNFFRPLRFSPNGQRVAFAANYLAALTGIFEPFVVSTSAGSGELRLLTLPTTGTPRVDDVAWAPDSSALAIVGDFRVDGVNELAVLTSLTSPASSVTPLVSPVAGGSVDEAYWTN